MSQAPIFQVLPLRNLFDEQAFADSVQQSSLGGEYDENTRTRRKPSRTRNKYSLRWRH
jgi:hypothetical protein